MEKNYHKNIEYIKELSRFDNEVLISELKTTKLLKYDSKNEQYYFQYVGLIGLKDGRILSVLPKCISNDILNDKDGSVKKKIVEDMIKEGKEEIKNYRDTLDKDNQNSLEELEEKLNEKSKYLDKVQEILDKFNIGGILDNI